MNKKVTVKWTLVAIIGISMVNASIAATDIDKSAKVIKEQPIVINTVAQHYENPTLSQYHLCTKSRDECISKCASTNETCKGACPICPILIDQDILVQGINDTLYRLPIDSPKFNQTNIIRLTNEIRNIINTSLGNITSNNQNNISIYQNKTSNTGGKYGLGYNEKGPCCHLIEPKRCRRSIDGPICSHGRQRTCGAHCISRVIRSKRVVSCSETNPDDCHQEVEYLPEPRRPGCQYTSRWPFINCKTRTQHIDRRSNCAECYKIPYGYVMRGQVSRGCLPCFGRSGGHQRRPVYQPNPIYYGGYGQYPMYQPYQPYHPYQPYQPPSYNYNFGNDWHAVEDDIDGEFEMPTRDNGWKVEERKCLNEDGTIAENCPADADNDNEIIASSSPTEDNDDLSYGTADDLDYDYGDDMNTRTFNQGSRRYRRNKY